MPYSVLHARMRRAGEINYTSLRQVEGEPERGCFRVDGEIAYFCKEDIRICEDLEVAILAFDGDLFKVSLGTRDSP